MLSNNFFFISTLVRDMINEVKLTSIDVGTEQQQQHPWLFLICVCLSYSFSFSLACSSAVKTELNAPSFHAHTEALVKRPSPRTNMPISSCVAGRFSCLMCELRSPSLLPRNCREPPKQQARAILENAWKDIVWVKTPEEVY